MLKLKGITKDYVLGETTVHALTGVDIAFRKNEFVAILGPSGCGKTTLLNIIGGLDRYTDGDLVIRGRSTRDFRAGDWDTYRNHTIGFVFQSYNLIPHQTVLANVELALTLTGVSKSERRARAAAALERVGLGDQLHKKPNQLSGGQMQRVAIARALVCDPDVILADEPTGALDSETSVQIMELLRAIAGEKLIIMVTHNPELADEYADRIVRLKDGRVISDSNPYDGAEETEQPKAQKKRRNPSMSFFTALSLSLNNLMTKKARTILTAFAGSIGIIGIAAILALSTGVQRYIDSVEEGTLSSYPLTIQSETVDMSAFLSGLTGDMQSEQEHDLDRVYSVSVMTRFVNSLTGGITSNDLTSFKKFLESGESGIADCVSDLSYSYDSVLNVYSADTENGPVQVNPSNLLEVMGMGSPMMSQYSSMSSMGGMGIDVFTELVGDEDFLSSQYEVLAGRLPREANELVFIVSKNNEVSDMMLYSLGIKDQSELKSLAQKILNGEALESEEPSFSYDELLALRFRLLPEPSFYEKDEDGVWTDIRRDKVKLAAAVDAAEELRVVGVMRAAEGSSGASVGDKLGYTHALTAHLLERISDSEIVREQQADPDTDVFTGILFDADEAAAAAEAAVPTFESLEQLQAFAQTLPEDEQQQLLGGVQQMTAAGMDEASILTMVSQSMAKAVETTEATYDGNLKLLGVSAPDAPSAINIYPKDFEAKEKIEQIIKDYNDARPEDEQIQYTDYVGILMKSVTTIVNAISYVLIAFVSISLIVSSIMIGIITYISVLERTKEIGILRAMGASRRDVGRVFNAETVIIGFIAGVLGICVTLLLCIPSGPILLKYAGIRAAAYLPWSSALVLIAISVVLTLIAGLIPARFAARKDPVVALRTE